MVLVANIVLLTVLGVLFLMSYERPAAFVFADLAWLVAPVLVNFFRFTDPTWDRGEVSSGRWERGQELRDRSDSRVVELSIGIHLTASSLA